MKKETSNFDINIVDIIKNSQNILIVGHMRPDGDCLGAGLSLLHLAEKYGIAADFLCDSDKPKHFEFIKGFEKVNEQKITKYDLLITVDCADINRMGKYNGYVSSIPLSVNIDHHVTNNGFCSKNIVRPNASSTCEIIFDLLSPYNEIDDYISECLFIGLSTDTGHFMHRNTNARALFIASKLLEFNIDSNQISNNIYRSNTINKTRLIARAINSMRFFHDDEICIITIFLSDLADCGCVLSDTEGLTDLGMNIGNVKVTCLLTEQREPLYKASYRSKSVDVAAAAGTFGGGGHILAAGCQVSGMYEDVVRKVVKSITDGME